ncbi:peptidoglycan-binding protein [Rhodococcus antarcticus]|uniref:Peptidoglycan-binding protein n=2 Tax=Rhodococcus antarcticus TaxID=2987751 RepID=A0ABY6P528_9NOCA|nr:peptidoglycan-binding protein [Rhodococcus antarcticus]
MNARSVQRSLAVDHGWRVEVDGVWGPHSKSILRQFQAEKGLVVDGVFGPATWTALFTRSR